MCLPGVAWYYLPIRAKVPAVGAKAAHGSFEQPSGTLVRARGNGGEGPAVIVDDIEDRVEICVLKKTRTRVSDDECDDVEERYAWYYIRMDDRRVPAVGKKAEKGSFREPDGMTHRARRSGGPAETAAIDEEADDTRDVDDDVHGTDGTDGTGGTHGTDDWNRLRRRGRR
ncbi:hypothetical protein Skr01_74760 [Sphaerisporangium krabiense]|uniref:Uncharacterized protein n=1 Tax=Sphaerisporangium krabiense TaxID=763782 RepID=A0A7W9DPT8_9ACTN|nr:hypothetical protein [Sphaerisporangium krabiense]MBB5626811.1 hypothetical protein [Sphaerisporangium krabiense]GII67391.1 hypothetical protein Skr01_74760 [Sphaerisporangium krabiense]